MDRSLPLTGEIRLMHATANGLLLLFGLMALVAGVAWASRHPAFAIRGITVTGEVTHNNALTLRANVAPRLAGTFFTLDLQRARQAFEAVPWVRQAVVRREFPNRLRVTLQEHRAVAYWGAEGESRLVNSHGEVFEANVGEVDQEQLPRLQGPDGESAAVWAAYQALAPDFARLDFELQELALSSRGGWRATLDNGAMVELGSGTLAELQQRAGRFLQTLTPVSARYGRRPQALESADLRHKDGYALRLRGVSTVAQDGPRK